MALLTASLLAISLATPQAPREPRVLHDFTVTSWPEAPVEGELASAWKMGSKVTVWPVACEVPEPKVDFHATFSEPAQDSEVCVAARLRLPKHALTDDGMPADDFFKRLSRCFKTSTEKAPDDVVRGLQDGAVDVTTILAARTTPTVLVIARRFMADGAESFSVEALAGPGPITEDDNIPGLPSPMGAYTAAIVDAPRANEVKAELLAGRTKSAVKIARAGAKAAKGKRSEPRALSNLAVAALLARDKSAVPLEVTFLEDDTMTDADYRAQESWGVAASWARGEIELGADPCK